MATPLYWKSWEISNKFYSNLLRYPFIATCDTKNQVFIVQKNQIKLIPWYLSVISLTVVLLLLLTVIIESILFPERLLSSSILMLYIFNLGCAGLAVLLMFIVIPCVEVICCDYWNRLVQFENKLLKNNTPFNDSLKCLLMEGMNINS